MKKGFLIVLIFGIAWIASACVEVGKDVVPTDKLMPIKAKPINLHITEGDTAFISLTDSITADRSYNLILKPSRNGKWQAINDSVFRYIPNAGFVGTDSTQYLVCPAKGDTTKEKIRVVVLQRIIPCVPVANNDVISSRHGIRLLLNTILDNDSLCAPPDSINFSLIAGSGRIQKDGNKYYFNQDTTGTNQTRVVQFRYTVWDAEGRNASAIVSINTQPRQDYCANLYRPVKDFLLVDDSMHIGIINAAFLAKNDKACPGDLLLNQFSIRPGSINRKLNIIRINGTNDYYPLPAAFNMRRPIIDSVPYTIPSYAAGPNNVREGMLIIRLD